MPNNKIYNFLKENQLTDKDEESFLNEYSNPEKAKELYKFFVDNELTDKNYDAFYGEYLKKKEPTTKSFGQDVSQKLGLKPVKPTPQVSPTQGDKTKPLVKPDRLTELNTLYKEKVGFSQQRLDLRKQLKAIEPQIQERLTQMQSLEDVYNNESLSYQERNAAAQKLNELSKSLQPLSEQYQTMVSEYNSLIDKDKQLVTKITDTENLRQQELDKDYSLAKGFVEQLEKYSVEAIAGVLDVMNTLGFSGDTESPETSEEAKKQTRENIQKIRNFGESLITQQTPEYYKTGFFSKDMTAKKFAYLVGETVAQTVPTVAAGLASGGVGATVVGGGMMFNESKKIMQEAGLNEEQAEWAAVGLSVPLGLLEKYGADDVVKALSKPALKKIVAKDIVQSLSGKAITKEILFEQSKKSLGKIIAENAGDLVMTGFKEAATEAAQGALQEAAKQTGQEFTGVDNDENTPTSEYLKEQLLQRGEEAIGGFIGGTALGTIGKAFQTMVNRGKPYQASAYIRAMELKDPEAYKEFEEELAKEVQTGVISPSQAEEAINSIMAIQEADALLPVSDNFKDAETRTQAVNLIIEKNALQEQIEGKDESLSLPQKQRIEEIDKELSALSIGVSVKPKEDMIAQPVSVVEEPTPTEVVVDEGEAIEGTQPPVETDVEVTPTPTSVVEQTPVVEQKPLDVAPNEALKDVESTAKALEKARLKNEGKSYTTSALPDDISDKLEAQQREQRINNDLKTAKDKFEQIIDEVTVDKSGYVDTGIETIHGYTQSIAFSISKDKKGNYSVTDQTPTGKGYPNQAVKNLSKKQAQYYILERTKFHSEKWGDDLTPRFTAEAYHKAKVDGSNPELVKAVDELLGVEPQSEPKKGAEVVEEVNKDNDVKVFESILDINDNTKLKTSKKSKIAEVLKSVSDSGMTSYIAENIDDIRTQLRDKVGLTKECKW